MRFILSTLMISVLTIFVACQSSSATSSSSQNAKNSAQTTKTDSPANRQDEAPRITLADAKKDFDAGNVVFIDTRAADSYKAEHIKGSVNIPVGDFETRYSEVPKDKKIIAYCS